MKQKMDHTLQFKITLEDTSPPVWRRILVPWTYSFWDLHVAIQDAMGWRDRHLHEFIIEEWLSGESFRIGIPDPDEPADEPSVLPGWEIPVAAFFNLLNRKARYVYDFGDDWRHRVVLESVAPYEGDFLLPVCVGGRRACPPEDCGGPPGYEDLVRVMSDPADPRHREMAEWLGRPFEAGLFDPGAVTFDDPDERWRRAFG